MAESKDQIVGHGLFTSVTINPARDLSAQILAPLAVTREIQGQAIGNRLVNESLTQLAAADVQLVFVLGYPAYYTRFGFVAAGTRGLQAPYPIPPDHADAWMVHELRQGVIAAAAGTIRCCDALSHPQYWQA
ncbi:GNAT family N-acetyltransferase [Novipirellula sp.]|uniref:GNAT family N-acetyltransferase n=1 Tax=Novipirellula sp. TaxID=2795430 RepID=UPI003569847F